MIAVDRDLEELAARAAIRDARYLAADRKYKAYLLRKAKARMTP